MKGEKPSIARVWLGVVSVLLILYGVYALVMAIWTLLAVNKNVTLPYSPDVTGVSKDVAERANENWVGFVVEFGILRALVSALVGLSGLVWLGVIDKIEHIHHLTANIWRELAAKNTP